MNAQEQFWSGPDGDAYLRRNQVDWARRIPFWRQLIEVTGARSAFEIGCNAGWNLSAIKSAWPQVSLCGYDLNAGAVEQAQNAGLKVLRSESMPPFRAELVFTAGVLIHIAPRELPRMMAAIVEASYRWVLAVEYAAEAEQEIEYRGQKERLWKRPYGKIYEQMGCTLKADWPLGKSDGFDNCVAWLLEKPQQSASHSL